MITIYEIYEIQVFALKITMMLHCLHMIMTTSILSDLFGWCTGWRMQDMLLGHVFWNFFVTERRYDVMLDC